MRHLYNAQNKNEQVVATAKTFERRRCNHQNLENPLGSFECFMSVVDPKGSRTNKNRYIVATQNANLRAHLRKVQGVPLIYFKRGVMVMEPMADSSKNAKALDERAKFRAGLKGKRISNVTQSRPRDEVDVGDAELLDVDSDSSPEGSKPAKKKTRRGPKSPNPLSVMKSKPKVQSNIRTQPSNADAMTLKKRRRRHKPSSAMSPLEGAINNDVPNTPD